MTDALDFTAESTLMAWGPFNRVLQDEPGGALYDMKVPVAFGAITAVLHLAFSGQQAHNSETVTATLVIFEPGFFRSKGETVGLNGITLYQGPTGKVFHLRMESVVKSLANPLIEI